MTPTEFNTFKHIHILGIGGIGVSALARLFAHEGKDVSGQDTDASPVTEELAAKGIAVHLGQSLAAIPKRTDLIIYSTALVQRSPAFLQKVRERSIPMLSYPEALGLVSQGKYTIAVSGTHGKTTTTAMIAHLLTEAGLEPTVVVGSLLKETGSNFIPGNGRYFVVEADEYRRQFLALNPTVVVVTNIGLDHLDCYKDLSDIHSAFSALVAKAPGTGYVVTRPDLPSVAPILADSKAKAVNYRDFYPAGVTLPLPGEHNRENAAAALAVAHLLGIDKKQALASLQNFKGTWRRFDYKGKTKSGALVYDDYAHNPDKVRAALAGYREKYPRRRLIVAFQPHLYSRTKTLLEGFASAFGEADIVLLAPIFAAREKDDKTISSKILAEHIGAHSGRAKKPAVVCVKNFTELERRLGRLAKKGDVLVTMGAGDIYRVAERLVRPDGRKKNVKK